MALGPSYKLPKIHGFLFELQSPQNKTKIKPRSTYPKILNLDLGYEMGRY